MAATARKVYSILTTCVACSTQRHDPPPDDLSYSAAHSETCTVMIARTIRYHVARFPQAASGFFVLLLLAGSLSGCVDEATSHVAQPTRVRPTATPARASSGTSATPGPATPYPTSGAGAPAKDDWTILVYLDGDNDLEADAIDDFGEMASVGSSNAVNIVVQFDRISSDEDWDSNAYGDWSAVKRFRIERRKKPVASNQIADLGERNMGSPRTLADFVTWGIKTYPAQHYALIFWDHGASWPGVASDDSSDGDMLTLPELADALADVQKRTGIQKLDLIGFDACLMGQIDVLRTIAPFGDVAVGSADLEPGEGWAWNAWLSDLTSAPQIDAAALAPHIIQSFTAFYKKDGDTSVTLAAFDLNKIDQLTSQLDALAGAMIDTMPDSYAMIGKARAHAAEYASGDTDISAIDLGYFADSLVAVGADEPVARAARALSKTIKAARIAQGHGSDHPNSTGISIYFPWKKKHYDATYVKSSPLTKATRWDEFLQAFYKGGQSHSARSFASKPKLNRPTASADTPLNLSATIAGADTAYVSYFVGAIAPSDPDTIQIQTLDYIYPPGATLHGDIPSWHDGDAVRLLWKASSWYISNGTDVILAPFTPVDYGSSTYSVDGTYTARKTGKQIPVSIEFEVTQGRGMLQHIWAFDKGGGDNPRPRELKPKAGDTFTPDLLSYTAKDDTFEERTTAGTPLTFGTAPLFAFMGDAPGGEYVIGLIVENIAGDTSDQYADVSVENANGDTPPPIPAVGGAPQAGATSDMLAFHADDLGFRLDYPRGWEVSSPGTDTAVFANPDDSAGAYLQVDVYALDGKPAAANRAILQDVLDEAGEAPGFVLRQDVTAVKVDGHNAQRIEYVYQERDGALFHVVGLAVSDQNAGATYLITFDAPEATFASGAATLERMLKSFTID
jgi:Clostripain family